MIMMAIAAMDDDEDKVFIMHLYKEYYGLVRKTVNNIVHDVNHTEDLINDTFIKLIEKISVIRDLDSCKTAAYVVYTSRSVAINFIKHRDVQNKHVFYGELDLTESYPNLEDGMDDRIIHKEEIEELAKAAVRLPEKHKDLLYFKYILEMDDKDIAGILKITPDSVRQYLTRARREAKRLVDKEMKIHAE